ncbi:MAG: hypothetical protein HETSPECPRED_004920 [Heterodermia speciosa]|uniref:Uncharacterized protein n=1 Tax=Heterodermia speciosa TaxID=116794 RepID=A0A8H3EGG3_9LECA|nr:MAG: hypothetical protein HETSPECPRED_004920 [Heterodermia speciosa]
MADSTSSSPFGQATRCTKGHLIEELRALEIKWIRCHDAVAGYYFHTWRSQSPASVALTQSLLGLDYRCVEEEGKIGCADRYENLKQREIWQVRGAVREAKEVLGELSERLMGLKQMDQGRNIREFDGLVNEIRAIIDE